MCVQHKKRTMKWNCKDRITSLWQTRRSLLARRKALCEGQTDPFLKRFNEILFCFLAVSPAYKHAGLDHPFPFLFVSHLGLRLARRTYIPVPSLLSSMKPLRSLASPFSSLASVFSRLTHKKNVFFFIYTYETFWQRQTWF